MDYKNAEAYKKIKEEMDALGQPNPEYAALQEEGGLLAKIKSQLTPEKIYNEDEKGLLEKKQKLADKAYAYSQEGQEAMNMGAAAGTSGQVNSLKQYLQNTGKMTQAAAPGSLRNAVRMLGRATKEDYPATKGQTIRALEELAEDTGLSLADILLKVGL